jgi:hypothetical protein
MAKPKSVILRGSAKGVSFDKSFEDAIKKAPPPDGEVPQTFTLIDFYVETGGVVGFPMSNIKVRCTSLEK